MLRTVTLLTLTTVRAVLTDSAFKITFLFGLQCCQPINNASFVVCCDQSNCEYHQYACLQVPDCYHPEYFPRMDKLVELNTKLLAIQSSDAPEVVKKLQSLPIVERMIAGCFQLLIMSPQQSGSVDINEAATAY
jgi:hypothetical protein